jgi:putative spermidine/putrescine transport system substrate-binding protein
VRQRLIAAASLTAIASLALAGCGGSSKSGGSTGGGGGGKSAATAQSAADLGGMDALVAAAKKEGALNIIAVPRDWAGYGAIIDGFSAKYGIKITSANPDGSSGDEINALKSTKGQTSAPDVVDIGNSFALQGAQENLFAPYKVATWTDIPQGLKDEGGLWYSDYGGYISLGCNAAKVGGTCPKTFKDLNNPAYKGKVALNGDPTIANAAFLGVWAAALANGGSADNIQPGIDFFKTLNKAGIFNKTQAKTSTVESGETPIVVDWDYLNVGNAAEFKSKGVTWTTNVPTDGLVTGYYAQAISASAPHPAAARLWEEYLYSQDADGGQNGWLKGTARPIELVAMQKNGKADATAVAKLPPVSDANPFAPTPDQITKAKGVVTQNWAAAIA